MLAEVVPFKNSYIISSKFILLQGCCNWLTILHVLQHELETLVLLLTSLITETLACWKAVTCDCVRARTTSGSGLMIAAADGRTTAPVTTNLSMMHIVKARVLFGQYCCNLLAISCCV